MSMDLLNHIPVAVSEIEPVCDTDGEIVDLLWVAANQLANTTILAEAGSVVGLRVLEFDPSYKDTALWKAIVRCLKENAPQQMITQQGRMAAQLGKVLKTTVTPKGNTCVVTSHEVTDIAKQRDDALRQFEYIKTACDHSAQGMVLTSENGDILYVNNSLASLLEYSIEELERMNISAILDPEDNELDREIAQKLLRGELTGDKRDKNYLTKSGAPTLVSTQLSVAWSHDRSAYIFVRHVRDVKEQRQLESERIAARKDLDTLKLACDHAAEGLYLVDSWGKIFYANATAARISGYTHDELIGADISNHVVPEDAELDRQISLDLLSGVIQRDIREKTAVRKDGSKLTVSVALSIAPGQDGEKPIFVAHIRDVTEERRTRDALKEALNAAESATRLKSEFLANMSHEIRTPLNGVLGMSQVLSHSELSDEQAEHVAIIQESGNNLMVLLNDILDLSKIEAGKLDVSPIEADLRHKLRRVIKVHEAGAKAKGVDLQFVVHPSVPSRLDFDPVRVRQCVDNLLSNAIKFTSDGAIVVAVTSSPVGHNKHKLTIHVSDTGPGIPPEKQDAIFQPFQQMDGSVTRTHGGTGLGLAITRQLAHLMDGDISLKSEVGRGSVFTLTFEAFIHNDLPMPDPALFGQTHNDPQRADDILKEKRVLIVDDNAINRQVARSILKRYGMVTGEANHGRAALKELHKSPYDIVLLDIHMPEMDGTRTIREIRKLNCAISTLPVIALTADAMSGDKEKYLSIGMTGYVSKPIDETDLLTEIRQCLSPTRQVAAAS